MNLYGPTDFAPRKYKGPETEGLPEAEPLPLAPRDAVEMPVENLGDMVDQIFAESKGEIDSLMEEFERLRRKLKTDGENIKRQIEEHRALTQQVMELTKTVSANVENVRASVDR